MPKGTRNVQLSFDESTITHFGGMWLIQRICDRIGLRRLFQFMFVLWLPIFQMVTGFFHLTVLDENRKLAPVPILKSWNTVSDSMRDAVKWFNDRYGFRDFLIRSKTQVDYSVFGMSTRVHIGQDGWLFYRSVMDVEKPNIDFIGAITRIK